MNTILFTVTEQIKNISILLNPIIPIATNKVFETLNMPRKNIFLENIKNENMFNHDKKLKELDILFKKIENDN